MKLNVQVNGKYNLSVNSQTNILDITVPKEMEHNVRTGHQYIDFLFAGDGITPSTAGLVTGEAGAGKTTLMLQLAECITRQGHIALYNTGEESLFQVRRTVKRLGVEKGFIVAQHTYVEDVLAHAEYLRTKVAKRGQHVFLIHDSLQTLERKVEKKRGRGRPPSESTQQIECLQDMTNWAKKTYQIVLVIGHVTKDGKFAGKNKLKHMVDCHLHLGYEKQEDGRKQPMAEMTKNRFGPSGISFYFNLTETGLDFSERDY